MNRDDVRDLYPEEVKPDPAPVPPPQMERGKFYDSLGPSGESIVVMLHDTWLDFGTNYETARSIIRNLTRQLGEAKAGEKAAISRLADVQTRLDNLRAVRRAEKRPEVEKMLGVTPTKQG